MIPLLSPLSRFWKRKNVEIYDRVFNLHAKVTPCLLLACTFILSASQYFGATIDCIESTGKYKSQMDHFCWMTGTFISRRHINGTLGSDIVGYGVAPKFVHEADKDYQKYYQWVSIFLVIHALIFLIPAHCWKVWEKRTLERLVNGLSDDFFLNAANEEKMQGLYTFFLHNHYRISHRIYALRFLMAEMMNLAAVAGNIALLNFFLTGFWLKFWPAVQMLFAFDYKSWLMASASIFPRVAKCEFFYVGPSGGIQSLQSLCLLPLNVLNEKVYAVIYLWFLGLFCISTLNVLWKILLLAVRPLRILCLHLQYIEVPSYQWSGALDGGSYSQWFLFQRIAKNLSTSLVHSLADRLCHTAREEYFLKQ